MTDQSDRATPVSAILWICAANLLFAFLDASAKYLVLSGMAPLFASWSRFAVHVLLVLILLQAWKNTEMFRAKSLPKQLIRGVFLFGSTILNFLALQTLQLAETMSIYFFAPMVVTAVAGPLLGEWAGWRRWLAVIVGFCGVLIITRPGLRAVEIGHLYALGSMLSYCTYVIMTRRMGATETGGSLIFFSALAPTVLMLPAVPYAATMPANALQWVLLLSLGVFGGVGHWMFIRAYKLASVTALAPYPYLQMVWMIALGYLVFDQLPDCWTLMGAGVIVASGIYIVHREHQLRLRSGSQRNAEDSEIAKIL